MLEVTIGLLTFLQSTREPSIGLLGTAPTSIMGPVVLSMRDSMDGVLSLSISILAIERPSLFL